MKRTDLREGERYALQRGRGDYRRRPVVVRYTPHAKINGTSGYEGPRTAIVTYEETGMVRRVMLRFLYPLSIIEEHERIVAKRAEQRQADRTWEASVESLAKALADRFTGFYGEGTSFAHVRPRDRTVELHVTLSEADLHHLLGKLA